MILNKSVDLDRGILKLKILDCAPAFDSVKLVINASELLSKFHIVWQFIKCTFK